MLRRVALVRTDFSEKRAPSIIMMTKIGKVETTLAVISNQSTLRRNTYFLVTANVVPSSPILDTLMTEAILSSNTSVLTRTTRQYISEEYLLLSLNFLQEDMRVNESLSSANSSYHKFQRVSRDNFTSLSQQMT
jgi:nucleoid-associated protein YejK